ncbi:MAG: hypothetical protein EA398_13165 [Deltaproteobacteria bacterium]|nr:MAG: hypothetical protein EA398_13165 [Deltaproteobacteria bacterium]
MAPSRPLLATLLLALGMLAAACSDDTAEVLALFHGDWTLDLQQLVPQIPDDAPPEVHAFANSIVNDMTLAMHFGPDGSARVQRTVRGQETTHTGTWELVEREGYNLQIRTHLDDEVDEIPMGLSTDARTLVVRDGRQLMVFRRP